MERRRAERSYRATSDRWGVTLVNDVVNAVTGATAVTLDALLIRFDERVVSYARPMSHRARARMKCVAMRRDALRVDGERSANELRAATSPRGTYPRVENARAAVASQGLSYFHSEPAYANANSNGNANGNANGNVPRLLSLSCVRASNRAAENAREVPEIGVAESFIRRETRRSSLVTCTRRDNCG